jgi:hypothetical protein
VKKLALIALLLAACGTEHDKNAEACNAAGSTLDYYGSCVWPLFVTSASPVPAPCSGVQRGFTDCAACHTMGGPGGWHRWPATLQPSAASLVTSGGCVLCHKAAP